MRAVSEGRDIRPSPVRAVAAAIAVAIIVAGVWKAIDYRMQSPPPPHPIGATP